MGNGPVLRKALGNHETLGIVHMWVTGGAGFLGSHVAEALLAAGHTVTIVDDLSTGLAANVAQVRIARRRVQDAENEAALAEERPAVIFHLAGDARVTRSVELPVEDCQRNLLATLALLEQVRRSSPETKVLFASSGAVYGGDAARPYIETDSVCPISPYAVAKLAAERYCYAYADTYGLRTCSLRLFSVYGPRQAKQVVYDLIRKIHANPAELALFGDGTQERDFSHVGNMVDAFLLAAEKAPFQGEVFNVAGDEIVNIRQLAALLCEILDAQPRLAFSGETRRGDSQRWIADTARIRALGYQPRIGLAEGLRDTVEWFLASRPLPGPGTPSPS